MKTSGIVLKVLVAGSLLALSCAALLFIAEFIPPSHVHAQNAGNVGILTREIPVFTNQAASATSGGIWQCNNSSSPIQCPVFPDGYATNYLFFCNTNFSGTIDIETSPSGVNGTYIVLVQASYGTNGNDNTCHKLQVGGYYSNLRANLVRTTGSMSAWYTASAAPISGVSTGLGTNGPTAPIVCDQATTFSPISTGTNVAASSIGPQATGDTVVICSFSWSFSGVPSAGTIGIGWASSVANCTAGSDVINWLHFTTAATPQMFSEPLELRSTLLTQQFPCIQNFSGVTASATISWASVHNL